MNEQIEITEVYAGFPGIAQGGYVGGLLANRVGDGCEVTFKAPPATGTPLRLESDGKTAALWSDGVLLAQARASSLDLAVPGTVALDEARRASEGYLARDNHPFPSCFCCGPGNENGLRIFVAPLAGRGFMAGPWVPSPTFSAEDGCVRREVVWAALDCPAIWGLTYQIERGGPECGVTGRMAVQVRGPIRAGVPYVVLAWSLGREGRKLGCASALVNPDGETVAVSHQTVILTDNGVPLGLWGLKGQSR